MSCLHPTEVQTGSAAEAPAPAPEEAAPVAERSADVATWATNALQSQNLEAGTKGTGVVLSIPLDQGLKLPANIAAKHPVALHTLAPRRRDRSSLRKREALLEGREGTRQRRRWENDHFKYVPNAQPPQPCDWCPQPTHPVVHVPYHLAKCWDDIVASKSAEGSKATRKANKKVDQNIGRVPREMREAARRNPIAKVWARSIEDPVRWFIANHHAQATAATSPASSMTDLAGDLTPRATTPTRVPLTPSRDGNQSGISDLEIISPGREISDVDFTTDNSDAEEVLVFHGRGRTRTREGASIAGTLPFCPDRRKSVLALQREEDWEELLPVGMRSRTNSARTASMSSAFQDVSNWRIVPGRAGDENGGSPAAMLFTPEDRHSSTYKRWIVHLVAAYYGLDSTSVDDGESRRRHVFVGPKSGKRSGSKTFPILRPMWEQL